MKRKQKVAISGSTSESIELVSGVAQGTVLEPLFFLIYVADISENITSSVKKILCLYKGEQIKFKRGDIVNLQEDLDRIYE